MKVRHGSTISQLLQGQFRFHLQTGMRITIKHISLENKYTVRKISLLPLVYLIKLYQMKTILKGKNPTILLAVEESYHEDDSQSANT